MNFDTRTIMDLISLNQELKESLFEIILAEHSYLDSDDEFEESALPSSVVPLIKNRLKDFLFRKELTKMNLGILKGTINLKNIDYEFLIKEVTS
jgi:hypothetical protein